jgi:cytochrome P450 family 135
MGVQTRPPRDRPAREVEPAPAPGPLPPGPAAGRVAQSIAFHRDPLGFLAANRDRFGDVFMLRLAIAGPMVVVANPRAADRVVNADPEVGHGGEGRRRILGMVSPRSVLGADDLQHAAARGAVEPAFAREAVESLAEPIADIASRHAAQWPRGRPFRVLPRIRAITDEIFVRLILGVKDERRAQALAAAIGRMLRTPGNPPFPVPGEHSGLIGVAGKRIFERRSAPVARLLVDEVDARRAGPLEGHDAIACRLRAAPQLATGEVVDQLIPLLMAGQEPPACALTWLLDRLTRDRDLAERCLSDPTGADARAIARETLRLTPAVHSVVRRLTEEVYLSGYRLPAGTAAVVPIVLLHRDPSAFPAPEEFRPERFLAADTPAAYLPFGGGNRRCLGEWLAEMELASVPPAVLRQRQLRPLWPRPERMVARGTVLVPHRSELAIAR